MAKRAPKTISAEAAAALVRSGDWVDYGTNVGQPDLNLVQSDAGDLGLGDAERVDALADDLDRAVDVLGLDLGDLGRRASLVDQLDPAA